MTARQRARGRSAPADELLPSLLGRSHQLRRYPSSQGRRAVYQCHHAAAPLLLLAATSAPSPAALLRRAQPPWVPQLHASQPGPGPPRRLGVGAPPTPRRPLCERPRRGSLDPPPRAARLSLSNEAHLQGGRRWI
uniref:Uncharacterized protein n=1 Tax=Setaria viridis TaxID=4556 RepID=A0A4U6SX67_SETVI|nr:hypothetical protein SEVIR_9G228900v2 [Setaria viridis]